MQNQIFQKIKDRLNSIEGIKLIDRFNNQYEGIIINSPNIYIEFVGPTKTQTQRYKTQLCITKLRVHLVSKILMLQDKSISNDSIESHDLFVDQIYNLLQGYSFTENGITLFNSMNRIELEEHNYNQGWFITTQDFEMTAYLREEFLKVPVSGVINIGLAANTN